MMSEVFNSKSWNNSLVQIATCVYKYVSIISSQRNNYTFLYKLCYRSTIISNIIWARPHGWSGSLLVLGWLMTLMPRSETAHSSWDERNNCCSCFHWHRNHVCSGKGFPWADGRGSRHTPLPGTAERLTGWGTAWISDSAKMVEGGAGPPFGITATLCLCRVKAALAFSKLVPYWLATGAKANVRKEKSTHFYLSSMQAGGIPHKCCISCPLLLIHPSIHPFSLSAEICKEATVMMKTPKMLHYGRACAAEAAACLWKRTRWKKVRMQVCGCYTALATQPTLSCHPLQTAKRPHLMQYDIHPRALPPPNTYITKVDAFLPRALILRKSIAVTLQPTLFLPMHQNVHRVKRRRQVAGDTQETDNKNKNL